MTNKISKKPNSIMSSIIQSKPLPPKEKEVKSEADINNNSVAIEEAQVKEEKTVSSNKSKKTSKKHFFEEILDNVSFETRKAKYVTNEMSEKLSMLSSLTGYSEQIIIHSILQDYFKKNDDNIKSLIRDFLK